MKSTIFLDPDFNFLLLENEESDTPGQTKLFVNVNTSAAANQRFDVSVAGAAPITIFLPSNARVNYELASQFWADDAATEITPSNADGTGATLKINFPKSFDTSAALNYVSDTEFDIAAQNEDFANAGSSSSGSGAIGSAFDFVETIRNIGFRLLDEPSNASAYYDEANAEVQLKWTDPADINTNEPAPAEWAGTVVVRKEGGAPLHKWDGTLITDSTTRDQYASNALIDNTIQLDHSYFYGIFPYDTKGDYRFTKVLQVGAEISNEPKIISLVVVDYESITVNYEIASGFTWDYITLVYKKNSAPADKTDGTAVSLSASNTSVDITGLDDNTTYYFKIFAMVQGGSVEFESNTENATTAERLPEVYRCIDKITVGGVDIPLLQIDDFSIIPSSIKESASFTVQRIYTSMSAASYVTDNGEILYHQDKTNATEAKRVLVSSEYMEVACPSGIMHDPYEGNIDGMKATTPTVSPYIGASYNYLNYNNSYINYYLGVIIEETYHRGYMLFQWFISGNYIDSGYKIWAIGGVVNGVDYIYETFKDM